MSQIAICIGSIVIYWSSIVIALGVAVCCLLTYSLYSANNGGKSKGLLVMFPIAIVLSVVLARLIHWYCHHEQYTSLMSALFDYSTGDYCLCGVFMGVILAVLIVKGLRLIEDSGKVFDALVPGSILGIALIRLSAMFNTSCRSKIVVENEAFQRLPFATGTVINGEMEYRFATFFAEFLVLLVLFVIMMGMYNRRKDWPMKGDTRQSGHIGLLFLVFYSALIVVSDSTRYDSSYLPINGFVSFVQVLGAFCLVGGMTYYMIRSVKANGVNWKQIVLLVIFLGCVGGTGYLEYLVQRHGDWYLMCYSLMSLTCFMMALTIYLMYRTVCLPKKQVKAMRMAAAEAAAAEAAGYTFEAADGE